MPTHYRAEVFSVEQARKLVTSLRLHYRNVYLTYYRGHTYVTAF